MKRFLFTAIIFVISYGGHSIQAQNSAKNSERSPNFIIIMADDLGYGDISPYDGWIDTPNLARMAGEGMRFTNYYASGPVCSPTRAGLLTGRYQQRAGIPGVVYAAPDRNRHHGLQHNELTFAEVLRDAGYKTGMFGKWHLGYEKQYNPIHHGFDEFKGYVSGNVDYFAHVDQAGFYDWWSQDELINEPGYVTHLITQHAISFIERNQDNPFVLYLPHEAPHYPFQGPEDEPFRIVGAQVPEGRDPESVKRAYREMVEELDAGVGAVLNTLDRLNLDENTLVLFISDNGAMAAGSNGELRGFKGSLWEGGIRVPAIARWKGNIESGVVSDQMSISIDIMPTVLGIANINLPNHHFDGKDLSPYLFNKMQPADRILYWEYGNQSTIRNGDWKLIQSIGNSETSRLFNLRENVDESVDIANQHPNRAHEMLALLNAWKLDIKKGATPQPVK